MESREVEFRRTESARQRNQVSRHRRGTLFSNIFPSCAGVKSTGGGGLRFHEETVESDGAAARRASERASERAARAHRARPGNSIRGVSAKSVVLLVCYFSDPRSSSFAWNFETAQNSQAPGPRHHRSSPPRGRSIARARNASGSSLIRRSLEFLIEEFLFSLSLSLSLSLSFSLFAISAVASACVRLPSRRALHFAPEPERLPFGARGAGSLRS